MGIDCGTFSDDLVTPLITLDDQTPGHDSGQGYWYCLRNVGSQKVKLSASSQELSDLETACTRDEAEYDQTCSVAAAGELGDIVSVSFFGQDCATGLSEDPPSAAGLVRTTADTPVGFGNLGPGQTRCFLSSIFMSGASPTQRQLAQTDVLTWRFAFTGAVG